jgi:CheY-like chemotaxis protein
MSEEKKATILCIEDEKDIRENIAEILRDEGFEVFEAENGKRGFEIFMQVKPDLVISDIMMPELDGYALLRLIRENKNIRNNNVPFIFLTALGQRDDVIKGVELSANDYLIKPIDFDLMIAKVKEKTLNSLKLKAVHDRNIKNIKTQVSAFLPHDLMTYLDIITQTASVLRQEPYGPVPHRHYLDDFEKIYVSTGKLRSAIINAFDENVINNRLNANEEIISMFSLLKEFVAGLSEKFRNKINIETPFDVENMAHVKIDPIVLVESLRKIFAGMLKTDSEGQIKVSLMIDHQDQMAVIFYLKSTQREVSIKSNIDENQVATLLENQNCRFEIVEGREHSAVIFIPSYRLVT